MRNFPRALALFALFLSLAFFSCKTTGPAMTGGEGLPVEGAVGPEEGIPVLPGKEGRELQVVEKALEADDLSRAEESLALLAKSTGNSRYSALHGAVLLSQGRVDEAEAEAAALIAENPADAEALYLMSAVRAARADEAGRKKYLDDTLARDPGHPDALADYGDVWYASNVWIKAEESYRKALERDPGNPGALMGLGRLAYRAGKFKDAEDWADKAIQSLPSLSVGWTERARARYQMGRYQEARSDLDKSLSLDPTNAWTYIERARTSLDQGDREGALADFDRAIELEPGYFLPYIYRAGMREESGDKAGALADYRKIIEIEPEYYYAYESVGILSLEAGEWEAARDAFLETFGYAGENYEYLLLAQVACYRMGDQKAAGELGSKVFPRVDREKHPLEYLLIRLFSQPGDTSEAELKIIDTKKLDERALGIYFLAEYWLGRGKRDLALKYFLQVRDMKRQGTMADRLNEAALKGLGVEGGMGS